METLLTITWDVDPVAFTLGPLTVRWYGILFATGFILGYHYMRNVFRREERPEADLERLLVYLIVGTLVGARLGHCLLYEPELYLSEPWEIIKFWKGGLASHGGVVGVMTALYLYSRKRPEQSFLWLTDRLVAPVGLTSACIRIGNLFNAEILGTPTGLPWAFRFRDTYSQELGEWQFTEPLHPAQLYESATYLSIAILAFFLYRGFAPRIRGGLLVGMFFTVAFTARFCIEFVKERQAEHVRDSVLNMGQWLSIPIVILGLVLIVRALARKPAEPVEVERAA